MNYTPSKVRFLLQQYQSLAQGARLSPPEDRLGSRPPPLDEAPFCSTARQKADIEMALKALPFERMMTVFMSVCLGSWRNGMKGHNWREKVGDWWSVTGGDVNKVVEESIEEMADSLNGAEFEDGENDAETVNEQRGSHAAVFTVDNSRS